eukprot:COSAG01_NODE_1798_length_9184_cov_6.067860_12_plen_120_part_00
MRQRITSLEDDLDRQRIKAITATEAYQKMVGQQQHLTQFSLLPLGCWPAMPISSRQPARRLCQRPEARNGHGPPSLLHPRARRWWSCSSGTPAPWRSSRSLWRRLRSWRATRTCTISGT